MKTNLPEAVFGNRPTDAFHWVFLGLVSLFLCTFLECPKIVQRVHVEIAIQKGLNKSRVNNLKILVTHDLFSLHYKVVVIFKPPLQGLCYTVRDAVDWFIAPCIAITLAQKMILRQYLHFVLTLKSLTSLSDLTINGNPPQFPGKHLRLRLFPV